MSETPATLATMSTEQVAALNAKLTKQVIRKYAIITLGTAAATIAAITLLNKARSDENDD